MRYLAAIVFLLSPFVFRAEDHLTGIWKGTLTQGPGGCYSHYFIELRINTTNNQIIGRTHVYYDSGKYVNLGFTGRYNPNTRRMVIIETKVEQFNVPIDCVPCIKTYELVYSKNGEAETLSGDWKGHLNDKKIDCPPGKVVLKKASSIEFPEDISQNDSLSLIQQSLHLQPRTMELVKTVLINNPRVKIQLYDNAEIDNDTITVFINNKLLLYRQCLTDKPLTLYINALPNTIYELVMYADNLGLISPNTALMVVTAGQDKMEVFLSSSEEKSAAVKFIYKTKVE